MRITHLLKHTITVANPTGQSGTGDYTYGTQYTLAARVERSNNVVDQSDGSQLATSHVITTEAALPHEARVWFPGDDTADTTEAHRVVQAKQADTFNGYTIYEAYA